MKSIGILLTLGISIVMQSGGVMGFQYDDNSDTNDRYRDNERDRYDGRNRSEDYRDGDNSPSYRPYYHHHHHHHHHHHKCQSERFEHQVIMKNYKDSTGHWVLYSQIIETRNIGNRCNHNEYIYLAHRQKSGWLWNPKINSLVHFSLGEPKFISRRVRLANRPNHHAIVNMSQNYTSQSVDLDRVFPRRFAGEIVSIGNDDLKWSEVARRSMPVLHLETAFFETVLRHENAGQQRLKVLNPYRSNREILE
jgi:hypothetical protein